MSTLRANKEQYNGGSYIMKSFKICILHLLGLLVRFVMKPAMYAVGPLMEEMVTWKTRVC
jgi:hypothetical protein